MTGPPAGPRHRSRLSILTSAARALSLKAELNRRNLSYADLAERLAATGEKDNEHNISNKIARGSFSAAFFIQCLERV